jgi:hypothetical protein
MKRLEKVVSVELRFNPRLAIRFLDAINPQTKQEYQQLMQVLEVAGYTWHDRTAPTTDKGYWDSNGAADICIGQEDARYLTAAHRGVFESFGKDVIDTKSFYEREGISPADLRTIGNAFKQTKQKKETK